MGNKYIAKPVSVGEHIRNKRIELKLFQEDVAKILGVSTDSVTNWESNRSLPQVQYFPKIIKFLGYDPYYINCISFSDKIKQYRYLNGLSQKNIAKILNVDPSTVAQWEDGKSEPLKKNLDKIIKHIEYEP